VKDLKTSKFGGGRTHVDIGGDRFTNSGHKTRWQQVYRFGPQNWAAAGFPVWASKSRARPVQSDGGDEEHVAPSRNLRRGESIVKAVCPSDSSIKKVELFCLCVGGYRSY